MTSSYIQVAKRSIHRIIAHTVAFMLRPGAIVDPGNFRLWERNGYHITPLHFYQPIPDTRELLGKVSFVSELSGIDMNIKQQLEFMKTIFPCFASEYNKIPVHSRDADEFFLDNDAFLGNDPHIYYCMIRHFQPNTTIEVGSGFSTLLAMNAMRKNNNGSKLVVIDPWPRDFIVRGVQGVELIRQKVEDIDISIFSRLQQNDILFIDTSHVVRTGGDVNNLLLEVLPRLAPGVVIHVHDIFLPYEYPAEWLFEEHRFWTEQYLLQGYLVENSHVEVLFASHFISREFPDELKQTFPRSLTWGGSSFWFRKR